MPVEFVVKSAAPPIPFTNTFLAVDNLAQVARHWAATTPERVAYTFLVDGEVEEQPLTCAELDRQARALAARLQTTCKAGDRALLLFMPGLEYIAGFFGCLYAGMVPVPAYPPDPMRRDRTLPRLRAIADDCQPAVVLGTRDSLGLAGPMLGNALAISQVLPIDDWADWTGLPWSPVSAGPDALAFLQYTSGSTGTPRGVMISHRNILYQLEAIYRQDLHDSVCVSWLPMYHDLGLIAGVLGPFYAGRPITLFSPLAFIQRPVRWLQVMSRLKATTTGGPNFAYDLLVSKFRPDDVDNLDLSHWRTALTGAEAIRPDTLRRFIDKFGPYGFEPTSWKPCFGLAEATLGVTVTLGDPHPHCHDFSIAGFRENRAVPATPGKEPTITLVNCGPPFEGTEVQIVDPQTRLALADNSVGEIWVRAPGVAQGYWNRPEETERTFQAHRADTGAGPYLRTGDLGFVHQGRLFINGRLKELMIFWGRNVYPNDIEVTVRNTHECVRETSGAAFSIERNGMEQLVVVQEVLRPNKLDLDAVAQSIREAILADHRLPVHALVLIKRGSLPKTSSGKVQRLTTRQKFLDNQLEVVRQWGFDTTLPLPTQWNESGPALPSEEAIRAWLRERIAARVGMPEEKINAEEPLNRYVQDSITLVTIALELEQWLGTRVAPDVLFDSPSLSSLANRLADPKYHLAEQDSMAGALAGQ